MTGLTLVAVDWIVRIYCLNSAPDVLACKQIYTPELFRLSYQHTKMSATWGPKLLYQMQWSERTFEDSETAHDSLYATRTSSTCLE